MCIHGGSAEIGKPWSLIVRLFSRHLLISLFPPVCFATRRREDEARRREEEVLSKEQAHLQEIHEKEAKRREREEKRRKKRHEQKIAIKIATEVPRLLYEA